MKNAETKPAAKRVLRELAEQADSDGVFRITEPILRKIAYDAYLTVEEVESQLKWLHMSGHINVGEYLNGEAVHVGYETRREKHLLSKSSYNGRIFEGLYIAD